MATPLGAIASVDASAIAAGTDGTTVNWGTRDATLVLSHDVGAVSARWEPATANVGTLAIS